MYTGLLSAYFFLARDWALFPRSLLFFLALSRDTILSDGFLTWIGFRLELLLTFVLPSRPLWEWGLEDVEAWRCICNGIEKALFVLSGLSLFSYGIDIGLSVG